MTLASHPVWPFEPNWESSVGETLAWSTDVLTSPTGAEQRRSLRYFPRRSLKFSVAVEGAERALFDNLLMAHASRDWYLPIWYDVTITDAASTTTVLPCPPSTSIAVGTPIFVRGETVYDYQISEVTSITPTSITLSPPLARTVPAGTIVHPMTVGRLIEQPALSAVSDSIEVAEPQFLMVEPPVDVVFEDEVMPDYDTPKPNAGLLESYRGFNVLTRESDWTDAVERTQQRLYESFEVEVGTSLRVDTANRPFPTQRHKWVLDGVDDHATFYALMQALRGRAVPVWMPTWMYDMRLDSDYIAGSPTIVVGRCGYTMAGGPRPEREDIMIEMVSGERHYRRILDSANGASGRETLLLDEPLPSNVAPHDVLRICFMSLMRLDQDSIEIDHLTDLEGVSEVQVTFRAAPNLRVVAAGF